MLSSGKEVRLVVYVKPANVVRWQQVSGKRRAMFTLTGSLWSGAEQREAERLDDI